MLRIETLATMVEEDQVRTPVDVVFPSQYGPVLGGERGPDLGPSEKSERAGEVYQWLVWWLYAATE
ncbi:MAG: hypothetical protein KatS3mg060_0414 [Dehalococcoidia bacterium]|nr:MAG: hypothetical protein KatS3mg060_0414 [Dehalococcoidia bacterium]